MADFSDNAAPGSLAQLVASLEALRTQLPAVLLDLDARLERLEALSSDTGRPMTPAEAAEYARVNVATVHRAIRRGDVPIVGKVGRSARLTRDALDAWMAQRPGRPAPRGAPPRRRRALRTSNGAVDDAWRALG
jgi:excisionase family DNA binding protein